MPPHASQGFLELLEIAERRYGLKKNVAKALGIRDTRYSRIKKGTGGVLSLPNLLKLSRLIDRPLEQVLVAAGKQDVVALLKALHSGKIPGDDQRLGTPLEDELLGGWRQITRIDAQRTLILTARAFVGGLPEEPAVPSPRKAEAAPPVARRRR